MVNSNEQIQDAPQEEGSIGITDMTQEVGSFEDTVNESGGFDETATEQQAPLPAPEPEPAQQPSPMPQMDEAQAAQQAQQQRELIARRAAEQEAMWREDVGRRARMYQQQLENSGYLPDHAREQAKNMIQTEYNNIQSQQRMQEVTGEMQGRHAALQHFMEKYGLADASVIEAMKLLQNARTPSEMEREAARMKKDREINAELTQLRQGQVRPQTFDTSQGSAEASTSDSRLAQAYRNGDRSPAAVEAARRMTFGS